MSKIIMAMFLFLAFFAGEQRYTFHDETGDVKNPVQIMLKKLNNGGGKIKIRTMSFEYM